MGDRNQLRNTKQLDLVRPMDRSISIPFIMIKLGQGLPFQLAQSSSSVLLQPDYLASNIHCHLVFDPDYIVQVFIIIYSASISVALDSRLRSMIRKTALDETKFLKDIRTKVAKEEQRKNKQTSELVRLYHKS